MKAGFAKKQEVHPFVHIMRVSNFSKQISVYAEELTRLCESMKLDRISARLGEFNTKLDFQIKVGERVNSPETSEEISRASAALRNLADLCNSRYEARIFQEAVPPEPAETAE
jgi:hypothetical protein